MRDRPLKLVKDNCLFMERRSLTLADLISWAYSAPHFNIRGRQEAGVHLPLWVPARVNWLGRPREADGWEGGLSYSPFHHIYLFLDFGNTMACLC